MKRYLLFFLLPFLGCQKETDDANNPDKPLIPLAIGNYWTYVMTSFDQYGTGMSEPPNTMKVYGIGTKPGYYSIAEDGSEQLYSSSTEIMQYLPEIDDVDWIFRKTDKLDTFLVVYGDEGYKHVAVAHPGEFQVLGRPCYKNEYLAYDANEEFKWKDVYYIAAGIGIVRKDYYEPTSDGGLFLDMQEDLVDFKIDN